MIARCVHLALMKPMIETYLFRSTHAMKRLKDMPWRRTTTNAKSQAILSNSQMIKSFIQAAMITFVPSLVVCVIC